MDWAEVGDTPISNTARIVLLQPFTANTALIGEVLKAGDLEEKGKEFIEDLFAQIKATEAPDGWLLDNELIYRYHGDPNDKDGKVMDFLSQICLDFSTPGISPKVLQKILDRNRSTFLTLSRDQHLVFVEVLKNKDVMKHLTLDFS